MYHKMPLLTCMIIAKPSQKTHNQGSTDQIDTRFSQLTYSFCPVAALFSKHRMKEFKKEASYDTYPPDEKSVGTRGSMTLEMAVVLPLMVSFLVFFLFLFRMLWVQESMEEALIFASRTVAVSCFTESREQEKPQAEQLAEAELSFRKGLKECGCPVVFIQGEARGISLLSSEFSGDEVIIRAAYEMRMPCVLFGDLRFSFVQSVQSRKWIGNISLEQSDSDTDQWVYITTYGTVYHGKRDCRYLDLSIRAVNRHALLTLRNKDGKIYRMCGTCGKSKQGTVYVTDYGTHYHSSLSCSGLKRTIYMVKLSQTGGRKPCSKCGIRQS